MQSSFSSLYTANGYITNSDDDFQDASPPSQMVPAQMRPYDPYIPADQDSLVLHYMTNVLPIQYLLSDQSSIRRFIYSLIQTSPAARDAACALAAIHRDRVGYSSYNNGALNLVHGSSGETRLQILLTNLVQKTHMVTEGDAMAGLHAISTILFKGGRGAWDLSLQVASVYVKSVLENNQFYGPEDVMRHCTESTRFIIKTTMWFDVLASVTAQTIPRFLETYRQLFDPNRSYLEDAGNSRGRCPPETSMLDVMGCENNIVLAIAEISWLACWKETQVRNQCLSIPRLVERGLEIQRKYITPGGPCSPTARQVHPELAQAGMYARHTHLNGGGMNGGMNGGLGHNGMQAPMGSLHQSQKVDEHAEVEIRRSHTNDIFRASAKLYLHTVLSGDYPSCPEIIESVTDVIECLKRVPLNKGMLTRSVLRSVVFGICIAGCLTDNLNQREFLMQLLDSQQGERVGNLAEVKVLMRQVWERRTSGMSDQPVNWREVMKAQGELLLLV